MSDAAQLIDARVRERFFAKVKLDGPVPGHRPELGACHVWMAAVSKPDGYGRFGFRGGTVLAHRMAFLIAEGRWPEPCALHHCDNRECVRRTHLFEGTYADNNADMAQKNRVAHGSRKRASKLAEADVLEIRAARVRGESAKSLGARFGIAKDHVYRIARGEDWRRAGGVRLHHGGARGADHHLAKLTEDAVRAIRESTEKLDDLAARFGVDRSLIHLVRRRKIWRHVS